MKPLNSVSPTRRRLRGIVVKRSGDKTVAVEVTRQTMHPLYRKSIRRTTRYLVHDADNQAQVGAAVEIVETRPLSARKRWRLMSNPSAAKE